MKENVYRQLIEDSPLAYARINTDYDENNVLESLKITDINKSFENLFNIKKIDILNKNIKDNLLKDENCDFLDMLKNTINTKKTLNIYLKDKNIYLNLEIYNYEKDEYNIRATKLNYNDSNLFVMLRQSPFIAWLKDINGNYIDVNDNFLELLSLNYKDIIGKSDDIVLGEDLGKIFKEQDDHVIKENKLCIYDDFLNLSDSKEIYLETAKWPYTDDTNDIILGSMGVAIDVTTMKNFKKIIQKNEQNFLDLTNNLDELIIIHDDKKALYISPYFEKLYGFKPDKLYEDINTWYEYWDELEFEEEPADYDYKEIYISKFRVVKYGKIDKWILCKSVPIFDEHGSILKKVLTIKDITTTKKFDDELENLRLEFFSNLSHELRTPIHLITSTLQVIYPRLNKLDEDNKSYLTKYLDILCQNNLRLLKLVNNLIDITKIDSNNFEYNPKNKDIISFVEGICTSVVNFVKANNMQIVFDTDTEEKIIGFDLNHMERIVLNLISNAIKFNKENGKIEINISTEDNIKITIKDEGVGIPGDKIDSVFRRFEQVNKKMKREREGSGIGLSLVKSLVEMHDGQIHLNSVVGKGSEFTIILPDVLTCEYSDTIYDKLPPYLSKINKMEVEFSDIYL